jgi:hypothetical protein
MARRISLSICVFAATDLLVTGCGGSSYHAPPSCLQAQPCGGDVTGTWSFLGGCSNLAATNADAQMACPGASVAGLGVTLTGSVTFNADLSYTASNWHETFSAVENVPLSCASGATSCSSLSQSTSGSMSTINTNCSGTSTCACRVVGAGNVASDAGTFNLSGTQINMTGPMTSGNFAYCVEADLLHLMQQSTTLDSSGQPLLLSDLVAQRKTP